MASVIDINVTYNKEQMALLPLNYRRPAQILALILMRAVEGRMVTEDCIEQCRYAIAELDLIVKHGPQPMHRAADLLRHLKMMVDQNSTNPDEYFRAMEKFVRENRWTDLKVLLVPYILLNEIMVTEHAFGTGQAAVAMIVDIVTGYGPIV